MVASEWLSFDLIGDTCDNTDWLSFDLIGDARGSI